jgi:hypothetical protein
MCAEKRFSHFIKGVSNSASIVVDELVFDQAITHFNLLIHHFKA